MSTAPSPGGQPAAEHHLYERIEDVPDPIGSVADDPDVPSDADDIDDRDTAPADLHPNEVRADQALSPAVAWDEWIATALTSERVGLAWHLATGRDLAGGSGDGLPIPVLAALLHGRATRAAFDGAWHRYEASREALLDHARMAGGATPDGARALLLVAGALRPALAQSLAALDVLDALQGDIAAQLNPLLRSLGEMRGSGVTGAGDIAAPAGAVERRRRAAAARQGLENWLRDAPARRLNYQPATWLWQTMVARDGAIGGVVTAALADGDAARNNVRALIGVLSDSHQTEALILKTDEARYGRGVTTRSRERR